MFAFGVLTSATWFIIHTLGQFVKHFFRFFYFNFIAMKRYAIAMKQPEIQIILIEMSKKEKKGGKNKFCGQKLLTDGHFGATIAT